MDVVWLKRDVRLHDHGPFAEVAAAAGSSAAAPFCVLYLYEPDQLAEPTAHGSHVNFANEGLAELDARLRPALPAPASLREDDAEGDGGVDDRPAEDPSDGDGDSAVRAVTLCRAECVATLDAIHRGARGPVRRLLAHEETGHWASYERDRRVRRWCGANGVRCVEFPQSGAARRLRDRDSFSNALGAFVGAARHPTPDPARLRGRLVTDLDLPGRTDRLLGPEDLPEMASEHRGDRADRQRGGESEGLSVLRSFLRERGSGYSRGISSPNSSWSTCSRLSPYLAWGHLSTRQVIHSVRERQAELKAQRAAGVPIEGDWLRSLSSFLSRMHWRSHFIQKLESEPLLEKRDLCPAYQPLRRRPGDWNEERYRAWAAGRTGFPFVDACVRCLERHGWINFRMRAMLVSFACWNLWLDWERIAPHLGRLFLDFEPGIHYPQLQMQAGTTGINAMRVYSVTKQGKDQDPLGTFIRKYVAELRHVPTKHIHEPWKMTRQQMAQCGVFIGASNVPGAGTAGPDSFSLYPSPIVDEKSTAKVAKDRFAAVRKLESTKVQAEQVFQKHGSRQRRAEGGSPKSPKKMKTSDGQQSIRKMLSKSSSTASVCTKRGGDTGSAKEEDKRTALPKPPAGNKDYSLQGNSQTASGPEDTDRDYQSGPKTVFAVTKKGIATGSAPSQSLISWSCQACTFINEKIHAPVCGMCGSKRGGT